ncbi:MAG: RHS repeat-associated core domain-containing protein, partial [Bacteroidota bacterium]
MALRPEEHPMTITYAADYYPYGKILREWAPCEPERYLTTQHERDSESGYDNRGARLYDADVGRFLSVDPLAQEFAGWSGYNYVLGNSISLVDPDGQAPEPPNFEYTKIIIAERISAAETNVSLVSTHMSIDRESGQVNGELVMRTEQVVQTNDQGKILSFTSTWTTSVNGRVTETTTSNNFESADPQLQQTMRVIAGFHENGTRGSSARETPTNLISASNNPV